MKELHYNKAAMINEISHLLNCKYLSSMYCMNKEDVSILYFSIYDKIEGNK